MKHTLSIPLAAMLALAGMVCLWRRRSKVS